MKKSIYALIFMHFFSVTFAYAANSGIVITAGSESTQEIQRSGRAGLPSLRLGDVLDSLPQRVHCAKLNELPELCTQAKPGSGDGAKVRCLKKIDRDTISDNVQLCSYPYKAPNGMLAGAKVESVDVLLLDHRVIEIRATVTASIIRLLSAYEQKYGEPASLIFRIDSDYGYAGLNDFQKKVYGDMKSSISAILFSRGFEIESITWWIDDGNDMMLVIPPAMRLHNNLIDTLPSQYDDLLTATQKEQIQLLIGLGVAPAFSENPWTIYYTDFQSLMELSDITIKHSLEVTKKRLNDL